MSTPFNRVNDFDDTSAKKGRCYILNIPKPPEDEMVFRVGSIDFEGFLDISERWVKEAAGTLGWISRESADALRADLHEARQQLAAISESRDAFRRRLEDSIMENAELVTEVQRWRIWADQEEPEVDEDGNVVVSLDKLIEDELSAG